MTLASHLLKDMLSASVSLFVALTNSFVWSTTTAPENLKTILFSSFTLVTAPRVGCTDRKRAPARSDLPFLMANAHILIVSQHLNATVLLTSPCVESSVRTNPYTSGGASSVTSMMNRVSPLWLWPNMF